MSMNQFFTGNIDPRSSWIAAKHGDRIRKIQGIMWPIFTKCYYIGDTRKEEMSAKQDQHVAPKEKKRPLQRGAGTKPSQIIPAETILRKDMNEHQDHKARGAL